MPRLALQGASGLCVSGLDHLKFCVRFCRVLLLHAVIGIFKVALHTDLSKGPTHALIFPAASQIAWQGRGSVARYCTIVKEASVAGRWMAQVVSWAL